MGLFSLFFHREVDAFAKDLAETLAKRYPPALDVSSEKRVSENRLTKVLEDVLNRAVEFQQKHQLDLFGKARLGNEFRWQLRGLGYSKAFIDIATEGLMVYITRGSEPAASAREEKR